MGEHRHREDFQICLEPSIRLEQSDPQTEPIELSSVWRMRSIEHAEALQSGMQAGHVYRRDGHPNADRLANQLAELHHADAAVLTGQGMSAMAATCLTLLHPGDRILLAQPLYGKTTALATQFLAARGIEAVMADATNLESWKAGLRSKPKLAVVETISNPAISVPDLGAIAELCSNHATHLFVDNTFASPLLCKPLDLGASLVMESLTKIISGHADVMLGAVCGRSEWIEPIRQTVSMLGMASSPFDCWLARRGLATLPIRMSRANENAKRLAESLALSKEVEIVRYPGLASPPQHAIAKAQFGDQFGSMLSFDLRGDGSNVPTFFKVLTDKIPFCPSLGDVQTTLSHPASTSHRGLSAEQRSSLGISYRTIRVSAGIEETAWLIQCFLDALAISRTEAR